METIQENLTVLLRRGKVLKAFKLQRGKKVVFEKLHFVPDKSFGLPFSTYFQVAANELIQVKNEDIKPDSDGEQKDGFVDDNRLLDDSHGKSQSLRREEIVDMKYSGAAGAKIVNEIVKNSSTFARKTSYSQKKYLKKKRNKHMTNIQILRPTSRLLCKMYESREPAKICQMRSNTFAQMLTMANVHQGSKVMVVENCSGVLLSLIMDRLNGSGCLVNLHTGETPTNLHAASLMNFSDSQWSVLHSLPLYKIGPLLANDSSAGVNALEPMSEDGDAETHTSEFSTLQELKAKSKKGQELSDEEKCLIRNERKRKRLYHQKSACEALCTRQMDTLILACRYHPTPILLSLMEMLAPSRPFVVHCEHHEPLMESFCHLMDAGKAVNLKISDTFTRVYQVLPEQTHPLVTMNTTGGYLLTGIKVET